MNSCIGCHSCEVACAEQNGLPAGTVWRRVGEIEGGDHPQTRRFHLSMSCNHCLDPACLNGCPTNAYEKLDNGIVAHHADDCIGCQYCTWTCPYSVPAFQPDRRIVTKCDMCLPRLDGGYMPACVDACPTHAITVEKVKVDDWRADHRAADAPELPSSDLTLSTTRIELPRDVPLETYAASDWNLRPEEPHWPLVWLTLVSQVALGVSATAGSGADRLLAAALAGAGMVGALGHLGRPIAAWKALRNLRRSWLSREVALLSLYAALAVGAVLVPGLAPVAALAGAAGVFASARLYVVPGRPAWDSPLTVVRFFATALALGPPLTGHVALGAAGGVVAVTATALNWARLARRPDQSWRGRGPPRAAVVRPGHRHPAGRHGGRRRRRAGRGAGRRSCSWRWPSARSSGAGCSSSPSCRSTCPARSGGAPRTSGVPHRAHRAVTDARRRRSPLMGRILDRVGQWAGLDHGGDRYTYVDDPVRGPVSASRAVDRWVRTTCGYCSVGCGMRIGVRDGRAVAVEGDPDHPVNHGRLCPKGLSEHQMLAAEGRLTVPTVDGRRATWDQALDRVTTGFRDLLERYGPESVAVLSTGQLVTEEFYALGKLVRLGMGLAHYDGNTTLCMASAVAGYKLSFGTDGPPGCYDDLALADVLVLWGANMADNHPLLMPRVMGEGGPSRIIVVDPRVTKTAMIADTHLPVRPRGDVALLNGVLKVLVDEDLVDPEAVRAHVDGLDDLLAHLDGWTVERAAAESGIEADAIRDLARTIAGAERCTIAWTMGVNHSVQGTHTVTLINTIALLTGNVGRPGASPFSITGQCNAMGTRESGFTASMPGYRGYDDPAARAELAGLWGIDEARLPAARGKAYPDIVNAVMSGHVKGLWIIATNPPVSFPNREVLEDALRRLDLLVVQDGFETPTTALADVVLPAAVWGEKDGTYTNSERRVSRVRAAVEPPGEARSDFAIFLDLAERWGCRDELFPGWATPDDAFAEWRQRVRRAPVRLQRHHLRPHRRGRRRVLAVPRGRRRAARRHAPPVRRQGVQPAERAGDGPAGRARAHPGRPAARVPVPAQHRAHRRALAHPHEDRSHPDPRGAVARGLGRDAPVGRGPARGPGRRLGAGGLVPRGRRPDPGAGHGHRPARRGVHPVPLGRALRQPPDRRPVRPDQPRAQLQAVRGEGRGAADPSGSVTSLRVRRRGDGRRHPRRRARR